MESNEWGTLADDLVTHRSNLNEVEIVHKKEKEYLNLLDSAIEQTQIFVNSQEYALPRLIETNERLDVLLNKAEERLGSEDARTTELIKRLGLSLIVSSFLLAVLRYTSSIYREHYRDMRKVQYEAQIIRRFYIAMKSSFKTKEGTTPNQIIASFVNYSDALYQPDKAQGADELNNETSSELIKQLLSILAKRT
jgi:hypothetical protein